MNYPALRSASKVPKIDLANITALSSVINKLRTAPSYCGRFWNPRGYFKTLLMQRSMTAKVKKAR